MYLIFAESNGKAMEVLLAVSLWALLWFLANVPDRFFVYQGSYDYNPLGINRSTVLWAQIMLMWSVLLIVIF